ncbi:MAG: hypothetical protein D6744_00095 [Planctomycetota bacterium]|nr:MAG: hypothetical protein D6744_00095 [Planctomycetota bacterium]
MRILFAFGRVIANVPIHFAAHQKESAMFRVSSVRVRVAFLPALVILLFASASGARGQTPGVADSPPPDDPVVADLVNVHDRDDEPVRDMPPGIPMQYTLWRFEQLAGDPNIDTPTLQQFLDLAGIDYETDPGGVTRVQVEVVGREPNAPADPNDPNAVSLSPPSPGPILAVGGQVLDTFDNRHVALVPIDRLTDLAVTLGPSESIILPARPVLQEQTLGGNTQGQGLDLMHARSYRDAGYNGRAVIVGPPIRIAVFDSGFDDFAAAQGQRDVPPVIDPNQPNMRDAWGVVIPRVRGNLDAANNVAIFDETNHGTAVLEILYDLVPNARFYLYQIGDTRDFKSAITHAIRKNVSFINHSRSLLNQGWDDGTGVFNRELLRATKRGILFFNSAGNYAREHYQFGFRSRDRDKWHNFAGDDESLNVTVPNGYRIDVYMQFDVRHDRSLDLDLYLDKRVGNRFFSLLEVTNGGLPRLVGSISAHNATGGLFEFARAPTFEHAFWNNRTGNAVNVHVFVARAAGDPTIHPDFELFIVRTPLPGTPPGANLTDPEYVVSPKSITAPNNSLSARVVKVAAVNVANYNSAPNTNPVAGYSSRGPTNNNRTAVTIAGPACQRTFTLRPFCGTSCAAPAVCGLAAILKSGMPNLSGDQIRDALYYYALALKDWGVPGFFDIQLGRDDVYGYGGAVLPEVVIDVMPNRPNEIRLTNNPKSTVYVALMRSDTLDPVFGVRQIEVDHTKTLLRIGDNVYPPIGSPRIVDVNGDARPDALYGFILDPPPAAGNDVQVSLVGEFKPFRSGFRALRRDIPAIAWGGCERVDIIAPPQPRPAGVPHMRAAPDPPSVD